MQVIDKSAHPPAVNRGYALSMVVSEFRGHQNVEVHLFRAQWKPEEEAIYDWEQILGQPLRAEQTIDPQGSREVFLETFSHEEKEALVAYLQDRYADKLASVTVSVLQFPIPIGLTPLSAACGDERFGCIHLDKVPNYPLEFSVNGIYDAVRFPQLSDELGTQGLEG